MFEVSKQGESRLSKRVAIVGHASPSCYNVPWTDDSWEIWLLNEHPFLDPKIPDGKFTRMYEIHRPEEIQKLSKERQAYISGFYNRAEEIVTHPKYTNYLANQIVYDFDRFFEAFPSPREDEDKTGSSQIMYMIGDAIIEGYDEITMYGMSASCDNEYAFETQGLVWILGIAQGRGIKVVIDGDSELMRTLWLYAVEDPPEKQKAIINEQYLVGRRAQVGEEMSKANKKLAEVVDRLCFESENGAADEVKYLREQISLLAGSAQTYDFEIQHIRSEQKRLLPQG